MISVVIGLYIKRSTSWHSLVGQNFIAYSHPLVKRSYSATLDISESTTTFWRGLYFRSLSGEFSTLHGKFTQNSRETVLIYSINFETQGTAHTKYSTSSICTATGENNYTALKQDTLEFSCH